MFDNPGRQGRRHNRLLTLSGALILVSALAACTQPSGGNSTTPAGTSSSATTPASSSAPAPKTTVKVSYLWSGPEGDAFQALITAFNQSQSAIEVVGTSNPDQQAQVLSMQGSSPQFDISDTGNSQIVQWAQSGALLSLSDFIQADGYDTADFLPAALKNNTVDGKLYALPLATNTYQLLYNKKVLADAGFTTPPATFEDWAKVIAKVSKVDNGQIVRLGVQPSIDYGLLAEAYGGSWYDAQGNPTPNNPKNVQALQWWLDNVVTPFGYDKLQTFQSGLGDWGTSQYPFYVGDFATMFDGPWQSAFIKRLAPDLDWGAAPLPYPADNPSVAGKSRLDLANMFIPANAAHPREAWEFMKFILSKEQMLSFDVALANLPGRLSLLDNPGFADLPNFNAFLQALKSPLVEPAYSTKFSAQYGSDMSAAFNDIVTGAKTPQAALDDLAQKAQAYAR